MDETGHVYSEMEDGFLGEVCDGKVGFTGGYNLANEYFNYTHPYGQWKDTGIRLEGDAVPVLLLPDWK